MGSMIKTVGKVIIAVFVILVVLFAGFLISLSVIGSSAADNPHSVFMYELTLSTAQPMSNVSILIPVPGYYDQHAKANLTIVNTSDLHFTDFDTASISASIEKIRGVSMMQLSATEILPLYKNRIQPIMIMPGEEEDLPPPPTHIYSHSYSEETPDNVPMTLHLYKETDHVIDTKNPFDNEPLLMPVMIVEKLDPAAQPFYGEYHIGSVSDAYVVEIPVYASYDTSDENIFRISARMTGMNQWWVLGWQSNSYSETLNAEITGNNDGWIMLEGLVLTGDGVYK